MRQRAGSGILRGGKGGNLLLDGTNLFLHRRSGSCTPHPRIGPLSFFHGAAQKIAVVGAEGGFSHVFVHGGEYLLPQGIVCGKDLVFPRPAAAPRFCLPLPQRKRQKKRMQKRQRMRPARRRQG